MKTETVTLLVGLAIIGAAIFLFVQQQNAQRERELFARAPGQQLGQGAGNLISGIIGLATGGGGST